MDSGGADDLFLSQAWFRNLEQHGFPTPHPVVRHLWQQTPEGVVEWHLMEVGKNLSGLANYYSGLFGPQASAAAIAAWRADETVDAIRALPMQSVLQIQPLDANSTWLPVLESALRRGGYWTDRFFCFGNWYQPAVEGGFDAYWAARPSALRNTVARARKRLDKRGDWRWEILTGVASDEVLNAALDAFVGVYNQSWKTPEPCPEFMPSLMRTAALEGWLRLGLVWVSGVPVAAQVWLVAGGKANIFKLAHVRGQEKLSAGSILTAELMRHVMDVDHVREVDFLNGDDPYKADWMAARRERVGVVAFSQHHWRGWLAALRHQLGRWRRAWRTARG